MPAAIIKRTPLLGLDDPLLQAAKKALKDYFDDKVSDSKGKVAVVTLGVYQKEFSAMNNERQMNLAERTLELKEKEFERREYYRQKADKEKNK